MATTKAGSIYAEIRARLNKYEQDLKKAGIMTDKGATKIQRRINKISFRQATQSMANFARGFQRLQMIAGAGFATYGIGRIATSFLDVASSFEQMEAKLDILTQGRGGAVLEEINQWALKLPISTKKAVDSFVLMQAMGLNPTIERMQVLADVAAVMGDDALPRLSLQLGQAAAKGKIMQQDLNIMGEAGINAAKYLRDAFGMTVQELQKSGIDIQVQLQAIFDGMAKDFEGSTVRMAKSWNGLKAVTMSYITELQRRMANAGAFEVIKTKIGEVNEKMQEWIDNNSVFLNQDMPKALENVATAAGNVAIAFTKLITLFSNDNFWNIFKFLTKPRPLLALDYLKELTKSYSDYANNIVRKKVPQRPIVVRKKVPKIPGPGPLGTTPPPGDAKKEKPYFWDYYDREREVRERSIQMARRSYEEISAMEMNRFRQHETLQNNTIQKDKTYFEALTQLSERTAWAMQQNFSDLFFDAMQGKLKSFKDYAEAILSSIQRGIADMASQAVTGYLFGDIGATGGGGGLLSGLFGGTKTRQSGGPITEPVSGFGARTGSHYKFHPNEVVVPSQGGKGQVKVDIKVINNTGQQVDARQQSRWTDPNRMIAEIVLEQQHTSRSFRTGMRG